MLNRIYIIIGTLAIIVLAGAFIVPLFIQWGDYRARMEELAGGVLGSPVTIRGDIQFSLLPQPRLSFTDVLVGSPEEPAATVDAVEAEFSLIDFLRDNYKLTKLVLRAPVIDFTIDESGLFGSGVSVESAQSSVALGQASIVDATVRLIDQRSGENFVAEDVDGELGLASFAGPFAFTGSGDYGGLRYGVRFNAAAADAAGDMRVSTALQPTDGAFSFSTEGLLTPGIAPKFAGKLVYRQRPPAADAAEDIRGDLILESDLTASTDRILLSGYTLRPDENRAGTRLTGAASIQLGARRNFDAVISGGVFALPPRDATEVGQTLPYEVVRLLSELPAPLIPPMPGRVGIDLAEVGLRGFAIRQLRLDANTDGKVWQIEQAVGQLPGDTQVTLAGQLSSENDRPAFRGSVTVDSGRLDGLVALWRKPDDINPLFNQPGTLTADVLLGADALGFSRGALTLGGLANAVELRIGFGDEPRLDVVGHFDDLTTADSAVLGAMLPQVATDAAFGLSFPTGSFALSAASASVFGQGGTDLAAEGQWTPGAMTLTRLAAGAWGGIGLDSQLLLAGTLAAPLLSGSGTIDIPVATAPAVLAAFDQAAMPQAWRDYLARSAPASIRFDLEPANPEGGQVLTLGGSVATAGLSLRAELSGGLFALATAPLRATATLESADAEALTRQVGFGDADLLSGDEPMLVSLSLEGSPLNSLEAQIAASNATESLSFSGSLLAANAGEIQGTGTLDVTLADAGGLAQLAGAQGLSLPQAQASAQLHFEGDRLARLSDITGTSGAAGFSGELALSRTGSTTAVSGAIAVDTVSLEGLAAALFGRSALLPGAQVWPDGPIDVGGQVRRTRGTIAVSAATLSAAELPRMSDTSFELTWDETKLRLAGLTGTIGTGTANVDLTICCSGPLSEKTVNGRVSLAGVTLADLAPPPVAASISGLLDGGVSFEGTGSSLAEVIASLAGEGNFTLADFAVDRLAPGAFTTVAGLDDVLNMDPMALEIVISQALGQGGFIAPTATGAFTLAGGVARLANFIVEGSGARLVGSLNIALQSLGLDGGFVMTPVGLSDPNGLVGEDTSRILTRLTGTVAAPEVTVDLGDMVAGVQVRANEMEVDRLEVLQAEDAARQRAAAEERNRLIQAQREAAEAARLAAEAEANAARIAAQQEAQRLQQEAVPVAPEPEPLPTPPTGPFTFTLPPPQVTQPGAGFTVLN